MLPFDGYIRVSRVGERKGPSFIAEDVQRETIQRIAAAKGLQLGEIVKELDVKGSVPVERRKLGRLVQKIRDGESGGLIVWKVSRYSRDQVDGILTAQKIREAGGHIIGEDLDTSQPNGRALLGFLLGMAEEELDQRRAAWAVATEKAITRGVYIGNFIPHGYTKGDDGRLQIDPIVSPVIVQAFEMRAAGASFADIANFLEAEEVPTASGGKHWLQPVLSHLFRRRVYLGEVSKGEFVNTSAHEPLVSVELWEAAQKPDPRLGRTPRKHENLLQGLVYCASCGRVMTPAPKKRQRFHHVDKAGNHKSYEYTYSLYYCRGKTADGKCPAPAQIRSAPLEAWVEEQFRQALGPRGRLANYAAASHQVELAAQSVDEAQQELAAYRDESIIRLIGKESYEAGLQNRREEVERRQAELETVRAQAGIVDNVPISRNLADAWEGLTTFEKREALSAFIESVSVRPTGRSGAKLGRQGVEHRAFILWR